MGHILLLRNFKVEKTQKGKYLYSVTVFGANQTYSFLSDDKMNKNIEKAKVNDDEENYWNAVEIACKQILNYNDFLFDRIEFI